MITLVEALGYRCLRYVRQQVSPFTILVGPNASGKSTFLDVVRIIADLLRDGPELAVQARTLGSPDIADLTWQRQGTRVELAVEMAVPPDVARRLEALGKPAPRHCRYEVAVGMDPVAGGVHVLSENLFLLYREPDPGPAQRTLFPLPPSPPRSGTIMHTTSPDGWKKIVHKVAGSGNDYFRSETSGWNNLFRLGPERTALANLPEDEEKFPVATWAKRWLMEGIRTLTLNSAAMKRPCSPRAPVAYQPDGSNLPKVLQHLRRDQGRYRAWVSHVQMAIPEVQDVLIKELPDDKHLYVVQDLPGGLQVPAWQVSDGTLRLLALTVLAYLPDLDGAFLIEEPENGIHPKAIEIVFRSLSSVYSAQVMLASHSQVVLGLAKPEDLLCFAKDEQGATDIVQGSQHPRLQGWRGEVNLAVLFAAGVLG